MAAGTADWNTRLSWRRAIESANGQAAAFIFEPVSGATLGAVVPPPGYLQKIAEVCRRHGVLLIADEVMTGMGRTGRNFAIEHWRHCARHSDRGQRPFQRLRSVGRRDRDEKSRGRNRLRSLSARIYLQRSSDLAGCRTRGAAPPARRITWCRPPTPQRSNRRGEARRDLSTLLDLKAVGDVRGIGLLRGVEFVSDKRANGRSTRR